MKSLFMIICALFVFASVTNAQVVETKAVSKEEKAKIKQKQQESFEAAFKEVGLTDQQIKQAFNIMAEASEKSNIVKKDASLSEEDRAEQLKEISEAKNARLKELMGAEKYKQYGAIRKRQKAAESANTLTPAGN